ncbi:MAG: TetR/AcrR family transcriptional regulator [Cyclobacteriaceae bacterium]
MRYKEYNPNKVLQQSIALFWQKGYNGCSINEIVKETGVNRFSLYQEFKNKEGILDASLNFYRERYCDDKLNLLNSEEGLFETLKKFYMSFLEDDVLMSGCYFIHIGTELADTNEKIKNSLNGYLKEIQSLIQALLVKHEYSHEDAALKSRHLLGLYCTAMSLGLIHNSQERDVYVSNGINIIL